MMYKEQKGHSRRNNRNFVKKDLIDEAQESTNYIIEEEIHAPCGSGSVNATVHQMFEELKTGICLTTTLKQAQTVMKQAVTHLLMSILKLSHYEDCILSNLESNVLYINFLNIFFTMVNFRMLMSK